MALKIITLFCVVLSISYIDGFVRRDVSSTSPSGPPNILGSFQKSLDDFRKCVDQSLAQSTAEINEKQLQPVFTVVGDQLNRVSKAFDDLTAPSKTASQH